MSEQTPEPSTTPAKKAAPRKRPAKKASHSASSSPRNTHVVMLTSTRDAGLLDVVKVTAEDAKRLIENGHAREPREGEVKAAQQKD